jgi:hypothetical protein
MALSPHDAEVVTAMKQRELHLKRRQRAADLVLHKVRRTRGLVVAASAVAVSAVVSVVFLLVVETLPDRPGWWRLAVVNAVVGLALGAVLAQSLLRTARGHQLLARRQARLRERYHADLHTGRRWLPFEYRGEDISAYVSQLLHLLEGGGRFDSVQEALDFVRQHGGQARPSDRALKTFSVVAAESNELVVSSVDASGEPSSRHMYFVRSAQPGVWYVATAPEGPKVEQFDRGRVAVATFPTGSGATISSNRVAIRRAELGFPEVAGLYRAQVPGFVDGLTEDEQRHEVVYELRFRSARVDTWLDHHVVVFPEEPGPTSAERPAEPGASQPGASWPEPD